MNLSVVWPPVPVACTVALTNLATETDGYPCHHSAKTYKTQAGQPPGKPGKVREFYISHGKVSEIMKSRIKVREIVVCL